VLCVSGGVLHATAAGVPTTSISLLIVDQHHTQLQQSTTCMAATCPGVAPLGFGYQPCTAATHLVACTPGRYPLPLLLHCYCSAAVQLQ
jgi:hypothetical protein